jgi:hypothetical protein
MADPVRIKPEGDVNSPGVEDELDESTDLEFYNKAAQNGAYDRMYLARLPNYLWEKWAELGEDEEIQIGMIRQWKAPDGQTVRVAPGISGSVMAADRRVCRNCKCAWKT